MPSMFHDSSFGFYFSPRSLLPTWLTVDHALGRGVPTAAPHPAVKRVSCGIHEDVDFVTSDSQPGSLGSAVTPPRGQGPHRGILALAGEQELD